MATDLGVPVNKSLIVSRADSNGMLVKSGNTSRETIDALGVTVIFLITSKNRIELSFDYGKITGKGLRKP